MSPLRDGKIRAVRNLVRLAACRAASIGRAAERGPLWCVGIVRNESDIVDVWIRHLETMFDHVVVYDHKSTDGTREKLHRLADASTRLRVIDYDGEAFIQSELMTQAVRQIAERNAVGWVFFLDADEFVYDYDRVRLRARLHSLRASPAVRFEWINACISEPGERLSASDRLRGWKDGPANVYKSALNLRHAGDLVRVLQGNHAFEFARTPPGRAKVRAGYLLHLPIRSKVKFLANLSRGLFANSLLADGDKYGFHWKHLADAVAEGRSLDPETVVPTYATSLTSEAEVADFVARSTRIEGVLSDFVSL